MADSATQANDGGAGYYASQMVRLLAVTIDVVVDNWDHLAGEPSLRTAIRAAAEALEGLAPDADPEQTVAALDRLAAVVAELPAPEL